MLRILIVLIVSIFCLAGWATADDLYQVWTPDEISVDALQASGADPVIRLANSYLVLIDSEAFQQLETSGLTLLMIAPSISREALALDPRRDKVNVDRFELIFEEDNLRLFNVAPLEREALKSGELHPVGEFRPLLKYDPVSYRKITITPEVDDLQGLISRVSADSLRYYNEMLQSFPNRLAGTKDNNYGRNWIQGMLLGFGYESAGLDEFEAEISGETKTCYNVVATKLGTKFPDHYIVIGAHRDAVEGSPGADDDGSGTAGVLEIARALADVDTDMTIVFALFDAEEFGLFGSYHYAEEAAARGDKIVYMLNLDMIGYQANTTHASLFHGSSTGFSVLWRQLADSLVGINGHLSGSSAGSDHYPFVQLGYEATFVAEYIFSSVYHSYQDSTTYMNFNYMAKLVKASLATVYTVSATAGPSPTLSFEFNQELPSSVWPERATRLRLTAGGIYGGQIDPASVLLNYSINDGPVVSEQADYLGGDRYDVFLPAIGCGSDLQFYVSGLETTEGATVYYPELSSPHTTFSATGSVVLFADDFEAANGWSTGGDASTGDWERGIPVGSGGSGDPTSDFDGSGQCYLTQNSASNSDVDGGTVTLTSPRIDLSAGDAIISYARWFANNRGASPNEDVFEVFVSDDNGSTWEIVETAGPVEQASGGWIEHSFLAGQFVELTDQIRVSFHASDTGNGSLVEAAVDAFAVNALECDLEADPDGDGITHATDNCPFVSNVSQADTDGDGTGDACDQCPNDAYDDIDGDGTCADIDNCPDAANPGQGDYDNDGIGDLCDQCTDYDDDGFGDPGFVDNTCAEDNCPEAPNPDQYDSNNDGIGDACCCLNTRGDADGLPPGRTNIADITFLVSYLFGTPTGAAPICPAEANVNGDVNGSVNISDITYLVNYLFGIPPGSAPPACP